MDATDRSADAGVRDRPPVRGLRVQRRRGGDPRRRGPSRRGRGRTARLGAAGLRPPAREREREERETMTNLAGLIVSSAAAVPDRPAIRLDDAVVPYSALDAATQRVAGLLRAKGVEPGDRVGIMLPNVPYFPIALYGALRLGAVAVPMNPLLKEREVAFHLGDSGAKLLFAWARLRRRGGEGLRAEGRGVHARGAGKDGAADHRRRADRGGRRSGRVRYRRDRLHVRHDRH